ncbi:hypothetical protein [Allobranchiibius sp. GilTou73]|uniref:hypothetical protein n=1 Tax=Allobranchiibius sp. GilTou73 TaxID=2904523 RepID=UPI001F41B064|nr:hypothetical protein [Allobranchiibius sp. GilTou73]UIJ36121.1 hypothetical protein LVQ62_07070 [Allobranchiibius sp. GilTou73]
MTRRWLIVCVLVLASGLGGVLLTSVLTHRPALQQISQPGPIVVVRVPQLDWNSTSTTANPTLYSLARKGAVGAMLTRDLSGHSCTGDAWLTLSAGTRTAVGAVVKETLPGAAVGQCPRVPTATLTSASTGYFPQWSQWRKTALSRTPKADIGRLASTAAAAHQCVTAVGAGASLGAADRQGKVAHYVPRVSQADFTSCPITLVSLTTGDDSALRQVVSKVPADATLVVASLADDASREHLRSVVITGPGVPHGRLTSLNTRQIGMIGTVDLTALILHRFGSAAPTLPEARVPSVEPSSSAYGPVTLARDLGQELAVQHSVLRTFFPRALIIGAVIVALGVLLWRLGVWRTRRAERSTASHPFLRAGIGVTAGALASLPAATFLIGVLPWYRTGHPGVALTAGVLLIAVAISVIAWAGPWRRHPIGPLLVILVVTGYTVLDDAMHGSRLQLTSMMGLQPLYGGRYYGMGNVGYAMLATSALLIAALLADALIRAGRRDLATATVVLVAVPAILVDGSPAWGADAGGPVAMIPAFAYLALNAAGLRVTWQRVAMIGGSTALVVGGLAVLDYLRPPKYRTHLGDFVAGLRHHGQAGTLGRIGKLNAQMLTSSPLTLFVPLLLVLAVVVLVAPSRRFSRPIARLWSQIPFLGNGLAAAVICWVIGFFANDSGTGIPPIGMLIAAPLLVVLATIPSRQRHERPASGHAADLRPAPEG